MYARPFAVVSVVARIALPGRIHEVSLSVEAVARVVTRSAWSTSSAAVAPATITRHGVLKGAVTVNVGAAGAEPPRPAYCIRCVRSTAGSAASEESIIRG